MTTLVLSAIASAAAAYITAKVWAPGTLASAAMSPVIVALVKEGLRKPTEVVTTVVPSRVVGRQRTQESAALPGDMADDLGAGAPPPFPPPAPGAEAGPVSVYSTKSRRLRWRLALITGLLGFAVCVVVYTVPEVIAGGSVGRPGHSTTLFSGTKKQHHSSGTKPATTTQTTPAGTATETTPAATQTTPTVTQTVTTPAPAPAATTTTPGPAGGTPTTPQAGQGTTPAAPATP
jgi:hypothetical protein